MIHAIVTGILMEDATLETTDTGPRAKFTIDSVRRAGGESSRTPVVCTFWGVRATRLVSSLTQRKRLAVSGSLELVERNGKVFLSCRVSEVELLGGGDRQARE